MNLDAPPDTAPSLVLRNEHPKHAPATMQDEQHVSSRSSTSASSTPLPTAPKTPNLSTGHVQRNSHAATSPRTPTSRPPSAIRRSSSSSTLNQRAPSSPQLMKRHSRSSLGGHQETPEKRPTPKRSISNLITGLRDAQKTMESIEEPVPLSAPQIAMEHFARELASHTQAGGSADTVVILHDACYGHRYSRQRATKTTLSMIVERPERIHASVLGASAAYVRLGMHHEGARHAPHPDRSPAGPPPFKIRRTARSMDILSPFVTSVHGTAWMGELRGLCDKAAERLAAGAKEMARSAAPASEPEKRQLHEGDLYLAPGSLNAFEGALGGVADAVDAVFSPESQTKRAFVAVRPPGHHCSADYPSGFCWVNNVHVGIEYAAQTYGLTHAAMLDFDLHHGDGSQAITWERNSRNNTKRVNAKPNSKLRLGPDIGYYSLHDINSYPCEMGDDEKVQAASLCIENAHGQSIWNVHLEAWKTEHEFWTLYETRYCVLLEKARKFLRHHTARLKTDGNVQPRAVIFISAGFDASEWEGAGMQRHKVNVPTEFYARFTRDVVQLAQEAGTACEGRVISVLEGGYSDRALCSGVLSHLSGLCATSAAVGKSGIARGGADLDQMMRGLGINESDATTNDLQYDPEWWSAANLHALEMKVNPPPPPQAKKVRTGPQPTYATPTESFAYKVVDANKFARSISGTMREVARPARPPTPPPPAVDWVVATQELSKLLIPTDRQTRSCTSEELGGVRVKREPQARPPSLPSEDAGKPRQLRDRKVKAPAAPYVASAHSDELESTRSVSRNSRRQTIADFAPATEAVPPVVPQQRRASRRLSAGSALSSTGADLDAAPPPVPALPRQQSRPPTSNGVPKQAAGPLGVQVKKTRAPAAARPKQASAPSSKPTSPARTAAANSTGPTATKGGIDALTAGMKKVTLKVGSREEHDAKMKAKLDAERRARALKGAETRRVNAAARKAAAAAREGGPAAGMGKEGVSVARDDQTAGAVTIAAQQRDQDQLPAMDQPSTAPEVPMTSSWPAAPPQDPSQMPAPELGPPAPLQITMPPAPQPLLSAQDLMPPPPVAAHTVDPSGASMPDYANAGPAAASANAALPNATVSVHGASESTLAAMPGAAESASVRAAQELRSHTPASAPNDPMQLPEQLPTESSTHFINGHSGAQAGAVRSVLNSVAASPPRESAEARTLPVWSSTGPIPFAPAGGKMQAAPAVSGDGHEVKALSRGEGDGFETDRDGGSVWDVPVTPQK